MNPFNHEQRVAKEINLRELYRVIKRRFWIVAVVMVIASAAGWLYSSINKTEPLYQTSSNIIIDADSESRTTLQVIIKDRKVLEKVIEKLRLEKPPEALANSITVESVENTQVVRISVIDTDPKRAAQITNTTAKVFIEEIPKIIDYNKVTILSAAVVNPNPITENNQNKIILAAAIFGMIAGIGLIFLIDSLDDSVKSERDIERMLGIQVIGSVSRMNKKNVYKRKARQAKLKHRGDTIGFK